MIKKKQSKLKKICTILSIVFVGVAVLTFGLSLGRGNGAGNTINSFIPEYSNSSVQDAASVCSVSVYINGELSTTVKVENGTIINQTQLPKVSDGILLWYGEETFETEFDFSQAITESTSIYGKYYKYADTADGLPLTMDETFLYDAESKMITQELKNSYDKKGYAQFNVKAGEDFYISADISLKNYFKVAAQGWDAGINDRLGFALVNANGENYRMQLRSVMLAVVSYPKSNVLYGGANFNSKYLLGSINSTSVDVYNSGYIQLKNTENLNNVPAVNIAISKAGNNLYFYVNGEVVATQVIEKDFNGIPALLSYSFAEPPLQVVTYSNIRLAKTLE